MTVWFVVLSDGEGGDAGDELREEQMLVALGRLYIWRDWVCICFWYLIPYNKYLSSFLSVLFCTSPLLSLSC